MIKLALLLSIVAMPIASEAKLHFDAGKFRLIYGNDDRYEIEDYFNLAFIQKANSVAMKVPNRKLSPTPNESDFIFFSKRKLSQAIPNICPDERFLDQVSLGTCSGFLVAPNILVTAGHCMTTQADCSSNKWVFGFKESSTYFEKDDVYSCKKIITQKYVYTKMHINDYAVIELDRNVVEREPLEIRTSGNVHHGDPLLVIGYPMGLPMKVTEGAEVSSMNDIEKESPLRSFYLRRNYFTANLDSYSGNSGSPVFNKETGIVEGILIKGAEDFVFDYQAQCLKSRHYSNDDINTYEYVMKIDRVPGLSKLIKKKN